MITWALIFFSTSNLNIQQFWHLFPEAKSCADGLFQEVLGRKDQADQTRNVLNVLTRFRFLFYLPLNMERNIAKVSACFDSDDMSCR